MSHPYDELEVIARAEHRAVLRRWGFLGLALLALGGMSVATGVYTQLSQLLPGIGPPHPLDNVPHHIRYSGYLEIGGLPVNTPDAGTQMTARLYAGPVPDGGSSLWSQTGRVPVTNGRFTIELGDEADGGARPLPYTNLTSNRLFIELTIGSPAVSLPRQQLLTVPYAMRSGDVILDDRTVTVAATGADFASLYSALAWAATKVVRGSLTIRVLDGAYNVPGAFTIDHPDGARIRIIGNLTTPGQVVLNAPNGAFSIIGPIAQIAGFQLVGPNTPGQSGIYVSSRSAQLGPAIRIQGFENGVSLQFGQLTATDVQNIGLNNTRGYGFSACNGGRLHAINISATNTNSGVYICDGASTRVDGATISDVVYGAVGSGGVSLELTGAVQITNATNGYWAQFGAILKGSTTTTFTNVTTLRSPDLDLVGNANAYMTQ